jgi:molybdate transport system substrate-binding protein
MTAIRRLVQFVALAALALGAGAVAGSELTVLISGAFTPAYNALAPQFERQSGHKLVTVHGPSMGEAPAAIPNRLARGEKADVVIMLDKPLDKLISDGKLLPGRTDLATSVIGMAVKAGSPRPDIGSIDKLRQALLDAGTIAYSDSASGVYLRTEVFNRLGIAEQMQGRRRGTGAEPAAAIVARGEAELAFQQMSELQAVPGVDIVGPLPDSIQQVTTFSAGVVAASPSREAAAALIGFLSSPAAAGAIEKSGLKPAVMKEAGSK